MSSSSDFFGDSGGVPIGSTIFVPYSTTVDLDKTNSNVLATYPEGFLKPNGQILPIAGYEELRDLLNTKRVLDVSTAHINFDGGRPFHGTSFGKYFCMVNKLSGTIHSADVVLDLDTNIFGIAATGSPQLEARSVMGLGSWMTPNYTFTGGWLVWPNDGQKNTVFYPKAGAAATLASSGGWSGTGNISMNYYWARSHMYSINNTLYMHLVSIETIGAGYVYKVYKSTNAGASWVADPYLSGPTEDINVVYGGRHNNATNTAVVVASKGDVDNTYSLIGGSGTGGQVSIEVITDGAVSEVDYVITHTSSTSTGTGDNYTEGDVLTISGNGTATLVATSVVSGRIHALEVIDGGSGWVGESGIYTSNSEGLFTLRQKFDLIDGKPGLAREDVNFCIREIDGAWYCATRGRIYRSTDTFTWVPLVLPPNLELSEISYMSGGGVMLPRIDSVERTQGNYSADGLTWNIEDTWTIEASFPRGSMSYNTPHGFYGAETTSLLQQGTSQDDAVLRTYTDLLDETVEFQIPLVPDAAENGVGLGMYPLMRVK